MRIIITADFDKYKTDALAIEYKAARDAARKRAEALGQQDFYFATFQVWFGSYIEETLQNLTATFPGDATIQVNKITVGDNNANLL